MRIPALNPQPMSRGRPRPRNAKENCSRRKLYVCLLLLAALTITPCSAQRAVSAGHSAHPLRSAPLQLASPRIAFTRNAHRSGFRRTSPYPYASTLALCHSIFGDSFDLRPIYSTDIPRLPAASVFIASPEPNDRTRRQQHRTAMNSPSVNESSSSQPLMIELQNGHYVRVTNTIANGDPLPLDATPSRSRIKSISFANASPTTER